MFFNGFDCAVVHGRDGKRDYDAYHEYGVTENFDAGVITCWIACSAGDEFSIHFRDKRRHSELDGYDGSRGTIRIDGQVCGKRESCDDYPQKFWGVAVGKGLKQPLLFSDAGESVTTDVFEARADEGHLTGLGMIEVLIYRGVVDEQPNTPVRSQHKKFSDGTPGAVLRHGPRFLEEAKTSCDVSHTVRFGKPAAAANFGKFRTKDFNGGFHPKRIGYTEPHHYAVFRFKYRSKRFLVAQGHLTDDAATTTRNTATKAGSYAPWGDKDSKMIPDNAKVIELDSDSDDSDGMDVDSRYDRARSRTRFSTEPPSEDPATLERERALLRAKLEIE